MLRTLAIVTFVALSGAANATTVIDSTCYRGHCVTTIGPRYNGPFATIIHLPPLTEEQQARVKKWEEFCQPVAKLDRYGVTRYDYAHDGCEFGRSE